MTLQPMQRDSCRRLWLWEPALSSARCLLLDARRPPCPTARVCLLWMALADMLLAHPATWRLLSPAPHVTAPFF
jgi:hypothetical protein